MPKAKILPSNQLVLVDKKLVPKEEYKSIPVNNLEKTYSSQPERQKREMSEKQKENLKRLIEMNKQRALERRGIIPLPNGVPDVIPEDKEVIRLTKRTYTKKEKLPQQEPELRRESTSSANYTRSAGESLRDYNTPPPIHIHLPSEALGVKKGRSIAERSSSYRSNDKSVPKAPKSSLKKQPRSYYESDTKEESEDEESEEEETTDFDTDVEISKYNKKIEKRTQSLSSIEKQLQQLKQANNPYSKHSVF
jgi:hypothetical protein